MKTDPAWPKPTSRRGKGLGYIEVWLISAAFGAACCSLDGMAATANTQKLNSAPALSVSGVSKEQIAKAIKTCDELAASPYDDTRPPGIEGVKMRIRSPNEAMLACAVAVEAEPNNARLMYQYGRALHSMRGRVFYHLAFEWYQKAARRGHRGAEWNLGSLYISGNGVKQDVAAALKIMEPIAEDGFVFGQYYLGKLYSSAAKKRYVPIDPNKEFYWISKAAHQGNAASQTWLGWMYFLGTGVTANRATAAEWFERAAKQGDKEAKDALVFLKQD